MSLNINTIKAEIDDLEKKITDAHTKAKGFVQKNDKIRAMQQLKLKKLYEKRLQLKQENLDKILQQNTQQISAVLANDMTPERRAAAKRRRTLKQSNGVISEDARTPGMINRPCYTNCEKKSWCDPTGWCDTNYYCTPSNREGTTSEPDMKDQKCVPVNKKTKGGKKRKTKKSKKSKRKRKNSKRGGMRRKLNDQMITTFQNPHSVSFPNDCCPCVFKLLGMPGPLVRYYQRKYGNGFSVKALEDAMNLGYPNYTSKMQSSPDLSQHTPAHNLEVLNQLFAMIPSGMAAIGGLERSDGTSHCVAFAMNDQGIPIIFDAQTSQAYAGVKIILTHYFGRKETNIKHLFILSSTRNDGSNAQLILDVNGNDVTPAPAPAPAQEAQEVQGVSQEAAAQLPVANVVPVSAGGKKSRKKRKTYKRKHNKKKKTRKRKHNKKKKTRKRKR